jgi:hypothetical protein
MTNNDQFKKYFHCFPAIVSPSPRVYDITGRELMDFVAIMKFFFIKGFAASGNSGANTN